MKLIRMKSTKDLKLEVLPEDEYLRQNSKSYEEEKIEMGEKIKIIEIREGVQHIIPSGRNETLCGLKVTKKVQGSSLGMGCNCNDCLERANQILKETTLN